MKSACLRLLVLFLGLGLVAAVGAFAEGQLGVFSFLAAGAGLCLAIKAACVAAERTEEFERAVRRRHLALRRGQALPRAGIAQTRAIKQPVGGAAPQASAAVEAVRPQGPACPGVA